MTAYVNTWYEMEGTAEGERWFPRYFVAQPPHEDTLATIYYKVLSPSGPVFWREEGESTGKETSMFDLLEQDRSGRGLQTIDKEYTPWDDSKDES